MSTLFVYPTSRKILSNLIEGDNIIVDKSITIDNFFNQSIFIPNKTRLDKQSRIIFLKEAILKINKDIGLGDEFKKNFLVFLKNSSFIFKFFDEIFAEKSSLEDIETYDMQGEFIDHIDTLKEVYHCYKSLLDEKNIYDKSTITKYEINKNFLLEYEKIEFILEGYLSKKEFEIIEKCSQIIPLHIRLYSTTYNKKMFEYFDYDFEINKEYLFDLSENKIVKEKTLNNKTLFEVQSFDNRISQCSFVAKKIYDFVNIDKFPLENIAVILPDEKFTSILKQMDIHNNLNFAMGLAFAKSSIYKKLQVIYEYLLQENIENTKRIAYLGLIEAVEKIKNDKEQNNFDVFFDLINSLKENEDNQIKYIIAQNLYFLQSLEKEISKLSLKEILYYFLHLLKSEVIPHKGGGKVKVIGILESRNISFDGVIIVDFNDDIVPQISQKDIFLNSHIRKHSSIPTKSDRENLQKYYYKRIFDNSKKIAISYVDSDEKIASKFFASFNISTGDKNKNYNYLIFDKPSIIKHKHNKPFEYTNKDNTISFNKLKTFIDCKQKFYNQYILHLNLENTASIELKGYEVGQIVHNILKDLKTKQDFDNLKETIIKTASKYKNGITNKIHFELLKFSSQIDDFIKYMQNQFKNGYKIAYNEKGFKLPYKDFYLKGRIDKVEILNNKEIHIVDYKVSKPPINDIKEKLQLYIYNLAISQEFKDTKILSYNHYLPSNTKKYLNTDGLQEEFDNYLEEYKSPYLVQKCENKAICRYCDYSIMCNRV